MLFSSHNLYINNKKESKIMYRIMLLYGLAPLINSNSIQFLAIKISNPPILTPINKSAYTTS